MIDATRFRELITALRFAEANTMPGRHALLDRSEGELFVFCNNNAEELLRLVEADAVRRKKALDELLAMDADLYDDPPKEPGQ